LKSPFFHSLANAHYIMIGIDDAWSCFAAIMIVIRHSH